MSDKPSDREAFARMLREYHAKVYGWIERMMRGNTEEDYTTSTDYTSALEYYRKFERIEGVDYSAAIVYAQELRDRYDKNDDTLDEKADSIIKYLGGGSALVTFGALLSIRPESHLSCILTLVATACMTPTLLLAIRSVSFAIKVRAPRDLAGLPPISYAVKMAEHYKVEDHVKINLWLIFHPLCEAAHHRNLLKATLLRKAHNYYRLAMTFLLLPVCGIIISLLASLLIDGLVPVIKQ